MNEPDFRNVWAAEAIKQHREVTGTRQLPDHVVEISRRGHDAVTVIPLGNHQIDEDLVQALLETTVPTALVLVPRVGHYHWGARELAMAKGSSILTWKELYTALPDDDPRPFLDKNVAYNRDAVEQHSKVRGVDLICESSMRVHRLGPLSDVSIAVEYEYEFGEEALVRAIGRHPGMDVILNANSNGTTTAAAVAHAREARVAVLGLAGLMGALNLDGDALRLYTPKSRY